MKLVLLNMIRSEDNDTREVESTTPVYVNMDFLRSFNQRKNAAGTRLTFGDGAGFAVEETPSQVLGYLNTAYGTEG